MTSINREKPPVPPKRISLQTTKLTCDSRDPDNAPKDKPLMMDKTLSNQFSLEIHEDADDLPGSMSMNYSNNNNDNPDTSTNTISRNLFSEKPLENGSGMSHDLENCSGISNDLENASGMSHDLENCSSMSHDLEYLMSSTEESKDIFPKIGFDSQTTTPNGNSDVLFESMNEDYTETFTISRHSCESLGIVLGMNEIIDASDGEVRKVYVKKISTSGAMNRAMNESNSLRLGDEVLAINGTYIKNLSRIECLNLLVDLPNDVTLRLQRNTLPWTTGPRCSFYLNLVDKNPESILSPAPKLFTNEGKKIPDGYKLLEISLYKEASDLLGISIVPSYGGTRHYYQIKELEPDGICFKSKLLNKGDCLVSCNGNSLHKIPFNQCLNILKSEGPSLTFEVFRKDDNQRALESLEVLTIYDDSSEVNNNDNNNNNNDVDNDDSRRANTFTSELLIPAEFKPIKNTNPFLQTKKQEPLLDFSDFNKSDSKINLDISDSKTLPDFSDFETLADTSDSKTVPEISGSEASADLLDFKVSSDIGDFEAPKAISEFKESQDINDFEVPQGIRTLKASQNIVDFESSQVLSDFKEPQSISHFELTPDLGDSKASEDIGDPPDTSDSHSSSFECDFKNTLTKPLLDFLTGSPFTEPTDKSLGDLQQPIEACSAEPTPLPVVDEPCIQLTAEGVDSSPRTDWSSQLNMSEQSPANEPFSLDGLEEFSHSVINNANELNNNFSTGYPCSSNEDLISIDTDVLSPTITNPTLIFYNHADPWEAAGEAKSDNLLPDFQTSQSTYPKNVLNEFIDTVESPDYGSDPLDGLQENIMQVDDKKCLSSPSRKFGADVTKVLSSGNVSLENDLVEEERTSPISYDDSLSGSIGIHTADEEGDILPLSSRNSDNDLIEEIPESPDSGRAESPGVYKNNSYNQKDFLLKLQPTRICDDNDKMTDEDTSVYHTISDISRKNKGSGNHGSFDSSESCATSVGSFESCAETGEQDSLGTNPKHFTTKNMDPSQIKSLPRNAFSYFKDYQTKSNEKSSTLKSDPTCGKNDYIKKFSDNLFSRNYKPERKSDHVRCEDKPFQVEVLKGIIGLGMTLKVDDEAGFVKVTHIQNNSPIGRNGTIKVGDYILAINNTNIVGESDSRVQQILRLLPRGLIKVVASALPITDWKQFTEDAEKPSVEKSGSKPVTVSLTSPIRMPDSFSLNLTGRCLNPRATSQKRSSFSSALNVFAKDQGSVDTSAKHSPPTVPTSSHKNQCDKVKTQVKSFGFLNNSKQSPPLDKKLSKYNSSHEQSPLSSPEVVLSQVRMFENFSQKTNTNQEVKEPIIPSKQKIVEMFEPRIQKQFPEMDSKEALPDILQDHTNPFKKQFSQEVKNSSAKAIARSYDAGYNDTDCYEDVIVPVKTNRYKTFSALPKSNTPRILDSFLMWDSMDSVTIENQNKVSHVQKTVSQINLVPKDPVKEEVIIPKKKTSVQSLVNRFNTPKDDSSSPTSPRNSRPSSPRNNRPGSPRNSRPNSPRNVSTSILSIGSKAISEEPTDKFPRPAVMEETIEPIRKARITNMPKPMPISFSDIYDIDEVLIIEKTERKDSKPDLKMTLTGPYSTTMEVSEPILKAEKKNEVKNLKKPIASPRKYILSPTRTPKKDHGYSEATVSEPEVSIGIARRLPQSAVPDCIDVINIPEVVPTQTSSNLVEEKIVPQVKAKRFQTYVESPRTKRAKAMKLLGLMDDDNYRCTPSSRKLESKGYFSDSTEVNEDPIVPVARKSQASKPRNFAQWQEISKSSSCGDLPKRSSNLVDDKAKELVKAVIEAAEKELCRLSGSEVKKPNKTICDISGHKPWYEDNDLRETLVDDVTQIAEPELCAENKSQKLSTQKRNLPLIENGRPKPMPRRSLSPARKVNTDIFGEKVKTSHRSLPYTIPKSRISVSNQETNIDSQLSTRLISPISFQRSVSPSGRLRDSDDDSTKSFFSAPSSPMREQKPSFFKQTSSGCLESLLNSELQNSSRGRSLPTTPRHNRCLPNPPTEENKFAGRSLPTVPVQCSPMSSYCGQQVEFKTKTWQSQPLVSQVTSTKFVSPCVQLQDANMKWTNYSEVSSVDSPNQMEDNTKAPASPVLTTKTASLFADRNAETEKRLSPVSFRKSPTSWAEYKQTELEAPLITKSSFTLSSTAKSFSMKESESASEPASSVSLSNDSLELETPNSSIDELDVKEMAQNQMQPSIDNLPTFKSEIPMPLPRAVSLTKDAVDEIETSIERPKSLVTKPLDFEKETLSSPIKILSSAPVLTQVGERSPLLASPVRPVSPSRNQIENPVSSPSALSPSRSTLHLDTTHNDSAPTSPIPLSPRRIGQTNRKLPDIFQSSHTFKTVSSPSKVNSFQEVVSQGESDSTERSIFEHQFQKVKEVPNSEDVVPQLISTQPKTALELIDPISKTHTIEVVGNIPKAEVAVSESINIEPTAASALSEVKREKPEEVSKPEVAVSQFIGIKPTTAIDLSEKRVKTQSSVVEEDIAKPAVAVSQFIGIEPTTASNLSNELKENKVDLSRPEPVESVVTVPNVKKQEQNIEVLAPKSEVAISKSIRKQPRHSEPIKRSVSEDVQRSPEKRSPISKVKLISTGRPDVVTSAESERPAFLRHKSTDFQSSSLAEKTGVNLRRRTDRARPKTEIFSKELPSIFSKRKWCISTKSGQTNFALPSEPETIDRVVQMGLIDEDHLDHLLTSANFALDKMGFSNNEEIHIAILEKDATEKTGIRLKKGQSQELLISLLEPDGAAIKQKFIYIGDSLLLVNDKSTWNQTVMDVKVWLQTIETRILLVLCRHPMDEEEAANDCEYMDIILRKGVTGVGFCLEGGVGCPLGDRPISVKRIFKGGPAEKGGQLQVGDEILKVNDVDFGKQRHFVAWNHLKFLPEGDVKLSICRRKSHTSGIKAAQLQAANTDSEMSEVSA